MQEGDRRAVVRTSDLVALSLARDGERSIAQLKQFVRLNLPMSVLAVPGLLLLYQMYPLPFLPIIGLMIAANVGVLFVARRMLDRGQVEAPVTIMSLALTAICIVLVFFIPQVFPLIVVLTILALAVALPHVRPRRVLRLMAVAAAALVLVSVLSLRSDPSGIYTMAPSWVLISVALINAVVVPVIGILIFLLLWHYSSGFRARSAKCSAPTTP
jgi:hypothetical protein